MSGCESCDMMIQIRGHSTASDDSGSCKDDLDTMIIIDI